MILAAAWTVLVLASAAGAQRGSPNSPDAIGKLPDHSAVHDTLPLLSLPRLEALPPAKQRDWFAYIGRSTAEYAHDTSVMHRELRQTRTPEPIRAPFTNDANVSVQPYMTSAWFATDTARRIADAVVSFQAPDGGWSKHVDVTVHVRQPGESYSGESDAWPWISTVDNSQTAETIHFLNLAAQAHANAKYDRAIARGIDHLLDAQYPNGCYPQIYPLAGSYHDAVTFEDHAVVNVLRLLDSVSTGRYPAVTDRTRQRAASAAARGVECILDAQVRTDGALTAWAPQHDPLSLAPTGASSAGLASLAGLESAEILDYLMSLPDPSPRVIAAVHAGAAWFRRPSADTAAAAAGMLARFDAWSKTHAPAP